MSKLVLLLLCTFPVSALGNNGFNLIGFSTEGVAMGGADIAVARDALSLGVNPAGLSQLDRPQFDGLAALAYADSTHKDAFSGWIGSENEFLYLGNFGFAQPIPHLGVTVGAGLFAQGGSGVEYDNVRTAFGTRDELSSIFRLGKAQVGAALKVNDRLSLGISPVLFIADLNQRIFPDTSFASDKASFFGLKNDDLRGLGVGGQVGLLCRPVDWLALAATYATGSDIDLEHGSVRADFEALGLGRVKYREAKIQGFSIPPQAGVGAAIQATSDFLLSVELSWINWDSLKTLTLKAKNPNDPAAPSRLQVDTPLNWRDQYVMAVGGAYELTNEITVRAGYNYARNPVPNATLTPLFPLTTEHHVTLGAGYDTGRDWALNAALEYALPSSVGYNNDQLSPGGKSKERLQLIGLWMQISYRW